VWILQYAYHRALRKKRHLVSNHFYTGEGLEVAVEIAPVSQFGASCRKPWGWQKRTVAVCTTHSGELLKRSNLKTASLRPECKETFAVHAPQAYTHRLVEIFPSMGGPRPMRTQNFCTKVSEQTVDFAPSVSGTSEPELA